MINKFLLFLFFSVSVSCSLGQNKDALLWTSLSLEGKITKDFNFELNTQFRFDDNMNQLGTALLQGNIDYEIGKLLKLAVGYRVSNNREKYNFVLKNRFFSDLDLDVKLIEDFGLKVRLRGQYDFDRLQALNEYIFPSSRTLIRFRYGFDYKYGDWKPSLSNEFFYHVKENLISAYRINLGLSYKISKRHSVKLRYIYEQALGGTRGKEYIYQITYSYNLKGKLLDR